MSKRGRENSINCGIVFIYMFCFHQFTFLLLQFHQQWSSFSSIIKTNVSCIRQTPNQGWPSAEFVCGVKTMCDSDLILASKSGNYQQVQVLLNSNYSVHIRDKENATPLYWSACFGHLKITDILISAGSDVNAQVVWGSTSLHAASDRGHIDCVKRLIKGQV